MGEAFEAQERAREYWEDREDRDLYDWMVALDREKARQARLEKWKWVPRKRLPSYTKLCELLSQKLPEDREHLVSAMNHALGIKRWKVSRLVKGMRKKTILTTLLEAAQLRNGKGKLVREALRKSNYNFKKVRKRRKK